MNWFLGFTLLGYIYININLQQLLMTNWKTSFPGVSGIKWFWYIFFIVPHSRLIRYFVCFSLFLIGFIFSTTSLPSAPSKLHWKRRVIKWIVCNCDVYMSVFVATAYGARLLHTQFLFYLFFFFTWKPIVHSCQRPIVSPYPHNIFFFHYRLQSCSVFLGFDVTQSVLFVHYDYYDYVFLFLSFQNLVIFYSI